VIACAEDRSRRRCVSHWWATRVVVGAVLLPAASLQAGPRWMLIYYRQTGNIENADRRTIESHLFRENGTKGAGVGVTNQANAGFAIFGSTDVNGWNRINPLDPNNCGYDIRIYDPSTPTQQSPNFYWQNPAQPRFYSYVTQWLYVSDDSRVNTYPQTPVYHYDQVNGINQVSGLNPQTCVATTFTEPPGVWSDQKVMTTWSTYQAQTFVVPAGINRIISAQAFLTRTDGAHFTYRASIRQGSPTGPQVGPTVTSRDVVSVEFKEVAVCWAINDVAVIAGQTYALYLEAADGGGFNVYGTNADNYTGGSLYNGPTPRPDQDMLAVVVGVGYDVTPPTISRSPASFTRNVMEGSNLPNDSFTVANSGGGLLDYTISDNANWLSVNPAAGTSAGESDTITISYNTSSLAEGPHTGTITIEAPGAANTPQTVVVNLTVQPSPWAPCDFEPDGDVDQADFGRFQACYTGNGEPQNDPACRRARLDGDEDVDLNDFGKFQLCVSGPNVAADPNCAE